jgi:hypothetical protein
MAYTEEKLLLKFRRADSHHQQNKFRFTVLLHFIIALFLEFVSKFSNINQLHIDRVPKFALNIPSCLPFDFPRTAAGAMTGPL